MKRTRSIDNTKMAMFAAAVLAATSLACASGDDQEFMEESEATHSAVCVDAQTELRVEDDKCDDDLDNDGHTHMIWWYYPISYQAPAVGSSVKGTPYVTSRPAGSYVSKVPSSGGFGGKMGTIGG